MKTSLDCLPCFLQQTLQTARLATNDVNLQKEILNQVAMLLPKLDFNLSPPENSVLVYDMIAHCSGCKDPFAAIKRTSNELGRSLQHQATEAINNAPDPLYTAYLYSVAGNIIDYGSNHDFDAEEVIHSCQQKHFSINHYKQLQDELRDASSLLYLGDNSGEIVFDTLVVKQLQTQYPDLEITFVVKQRPIINDALMDDAMECGLPEICTVIDNGTGCPGAPLDQCSSEFKEHFNGADIIISKGQGNFETLSEQKGIYFLLICKCPIVGNHVQELSTTEISLGDLIFFRS